MERRFGHDFSRVRVHTDNEASHSARQVGARAYAVGSHIVFGDGEYRPGFLDSDRLIAHELAHVVQQGPGWDSARRTEPILVSLQSDNNDRAADQAAEEVVADGATRESVTRRFWPDGNPAGNRRHADEPLFNEITVATRLASRPLQPVLQRTCSAHPDEAFYRSEVAGKRYCQDSPATSQLHPGQRCYRQIPSRSGYFDCPPADQVCFDPEGNCHDSWDEASPVETINDDNTCNLHFYCSLHHAVKDKVVQTWWDLKVAPVFEQLGQAQLDCLKACQDLPWYEQGFCTQGCSGAPP